MAPPSHSSSPPSPESRSARSQPPRGGAQSPPRYAIHSPSAEFDPQSRLQELVWVSPFGGDFPLIRNQMSSDQMGRVGTEDTTPSPHESLVAERSSESMRYHRSDFRLRRRGCFSDEMGLCRQLSIRVGGYEREMVLLDWFSWLRLVLCTYQVHDILASMCYEF